MFDTGVFKVGYSRDRDEFLATFYPRGEVVVEGGVTDIAGGRESTVMVAVDHDDVGVLVTARGKFREAGKDL